MEIAAFRDQLVAWLAERRDELEPFRRLPPDLTTQFELLRRLQRLLYDAGWLRYGWPEEMGGLGGSAVLRGVLSEELAASGYPPPFSFGMMEVLGPAVARFAPPELSAWALPRLLSGEEGWCQGFSEPEAGSDLASLRLRAITHDGGGTFVVNGQKVWTSWAQHTDRCVLLARTGTLEQGHRGISAFFVDMDSAGVTVRPLRAMSGDAEFAELFFDDVLVPGDRMLGPPGRGWSVAMYVLSCERGAIAWQRQAWMHRRLHDLLAETRSPGPGVSPGLNANGRRAAWAGDTFANLYALRLLARRTLRRLAEGDVPGPDASIDKIMMATTEQALFDGVLDLTPDVLLAGEGDEAQAWRNEYCYARAASIYGGTAEIQRNIVAEHLLGLPREA